MRLFSERSALLAVAAAVVVLGGGGCYEVAVFHPALAFEGGRGSLVADGWNMGVSASLTGKRAGGSEGQAHIVLSVDEAYTARAEGGGARTVIRVAANVVNETNKPVRFDPKDTRLEVQGRVFGPKWTYRGPEATEGAAEAVEGGLTARYDMYFDLGAWTPRPSGWVAGRAPGGSGIPLGTIRGFTVSWKALLVGGEGSDEGGRERSGKARFVRDRSWAYPITAGPYWGGGWYLWADPYGWPSLWPSCGLIFAARWGLGGPGTVFKE